MDSPKINPSVTVADIVTAFLHWSVAKFETVAFRRSDGFTPSFEALGVQFSNSRDVARFYVEGVNDLSPEAFIRVTNEFEHASKKADELRQVVQLKTAEVRKFEGRIEGLEWAFEKVVDSRFAGER